MRVGAEVANPDGTKPEGERHPSSLTPSWIVAPLGHRLKNRRLRHCVYSKSFSSTEVLSARRIPLGVATDSGQISTQPETRPAAADSRLTQVARRWVTPIWSWPASGTTLACEPSQSMHVARNLLRLHSMGRKM